MSARVTHGVRTLLVLTLVSSVSMPVGAVAVRALAAPRTTIAIDPPTPDGLSGWWLAEPDVSLESDQNGTAYYAYNDGAQTSLAVSAGVPVYLTDVPQGQSTLSVYSVNSSGETETPSATAELKVDSAPPSRPLNASWELRSGNTIALDWDASQDAASGVRLYAVYRNLTGPPFSPGEIVGVSASPGYDDTTYPPVSGLRYAIEAWDVAGNVSLLSDLLVVDVDLTPPTAPAGLAAWINGAGWARVSWQASTDVGTGVAHYLVYRAIDGGAFQFVGTVPASTLYFDDHDPAIHTATSVLYDVVAVDRAGNESDGGGPVPAGRDLIPPVAPGFSVAPVWSGDGVANDSFFVDWSATPATDVGSGVLFYEVRSGPSADALSITQFSTSSSAFVPFPEEPALLRYFQVRVHDGAGNIADSGIVAGRNVPVYNAAGPDRIATSIAVSAAAFDRAETVVFASAYNYPDALCASSLAGKVGGPVLLVGNGALPASILGELARLNTADAYVIGGPAAIAGPTFDSIDSALSGNVLRVAGLDRYETAAAVAAELDIAAGADTRAYVVTGEKFPDALSVGAAAFSEVAPVLYARPSGVPASTLAVMKALDIDETVIVGGPAAVTPAAETILAPATRVHGLTRYETARNFADWALADGVLSAVAPCVATGVNFPDGLSAGPLAGTMASPVVLTRAEENAATIAWLTPYRARLSRVWTIGGPAAVDASLTPAIWRSVSIP